MIINFDGKITKEICKTFILYHEGIVNDDIDFEYGEETEARFGCGATLFGQFWYFGGYQYKRQVLLIFALNPYP